MVPNWSSLGPQLTGGGGWGCLVVEVRRVGWLNLKWKASYIPLGLSSRASARGWAAEGMPQAARELDSPSAEAGETRYRAEAQMALAERWLRTLTALQEGRSEGLLNRLQILDIGCGLVSAPLSLWVCEY